MRSAVRRIRRHVSHLLRVLSQRNSQLTTASRVGEEPRHLAAAGLARCRALLEGVYLLTGPKGRPDVCGVLLRSLVEAWAVSLLVLLKKQQAVFELAPGAEEGLRKLIDAFDTGSPGARRWLARFHSLSQKSTVRYKSGRRKGQPRPLTIDEVFAQVETLAANDDGLARAARHARKRIWRTESYVSTHANLASIAIPYVGQSVEPWGITDRPEGWMSSEEALVACAQLTGLLASQVYAAFGYRTDPILTLLRKIRLPPRVNQPNDDRGA
jgi:hypothetical protein